jgi:hypothetical protein
LLLPFAVLCAGLCRPVSYICLLGLSAGLHLSARSVLLTCGSCFLQHLLACVCLPVSVFWHVSICCLCLSW